ncbi:PilZ domain-containing protein [Chitinilyticum piscinae]|uniref:PilZ domain-containing protein n=1 Tax=Chitinilyticum piscinae TaxID=2866724 RepID=A0A8J7KBL0_9NEIS|nr:PilZ domain-containing protein [Chitinilyticum piscinae]MBE9610339.1 PilZ domain-containing protein [Chitinilyticum piscinae]
MKRGTAGMAPQDQRAAVRVPVRCKVKLRLPDLGLSHYGECTDLSVSGLTVQTSYVPRPSEEFQVFVMPPASPGVARQPMALQVRVMRCHALKQSGLYELGLSILNVLR